jgi:hypothetical protein
VKLQSQTKKRGKANYTSQVRQTLELGSCWLKIGERS